MTENPKTQGAREVFGKTDVGIVDAVTGTVKTTDEHGIDSASSEVSQLFAGILAECRLSNLHLSRLSGENFTVADLEDE